MTIKPEKPQNYRRKTRGYILIAFIAILLAFATAGIVQSVRTNNPAFLVACCPLLIAMWTGIWQYLTRADDNTRDLDGR